MKYPDITTLTTRELLSLTIREAPDSQVVDQLVERYKSLRELVDVTLSELTAIKGLGPGKASILLASIELGKRLQSPALEVKSIRCPQDVADLVMGEMRYLDREHFRVLLLNTKNHVLRMDTVSIGTLNSSAVHPKKLFKTAIRHSAAAVILVHNHPSGDVNPSREDIEITGRLSEAGKLLGVEVLDHVIIGNGRFVSFKERSLL